VKLHAAQPAARGHETILLVEDEHMILDITKTMLEHQGYTVNGCRDAG
jgi:two-component system cell cycle sensor histidine kinase/response regulator CckA